MNKVVVTGIGLVTPLGAGCEKSWQALINGYSGIVAAPEDLGVGAFAPVSDYVPEEHCRPVNLALLAAKEALSDARLDHAGINWERVGCTVSMSKPFLVIGEKVSFTESSFPQKRESSLSHHLRVSKSRTGFPINTFGNDKPIQITFSAGTTLAKEFNIQGPVINVTAACATGANSIIMGNRWINQGLCDIVLAGATESSINDLYLAGFNNMGVIAKINDNPKTCMKPFDAKRNGFIIGEGAGIVVLESFAHATKRGAAKLYGEIAGHAMGLDPNHIVHFNSDGSHISRVMKKAIDSSGLSSGDVDYLNAHGTATKLNDYLEVMAIKRTFGENASAVSVSSTKAATGHLLGAGGSVEFIFCLLAMRDNIAPPTLNLEEPDPDLGLDLTPCVARHKEIKTAMSVSFGFGGHIAAIVAKKP